MEAEELKCCSCEKVFHPNDSPYKGSIHLKKCERCFHLSMLRDAKVGLWTTIRCSS